MTTTADAAGLMRAILANPFEDTPRLMYADEIEADDPERAEFIRRDVASYGPWVPEVGWANHNRAAKLLKRSQRRGDSWANAGPHPGVLAIFRRGFVSEIRCDLRTLFGGACERCGGEGEVVTSHRSDCSHCGGTGRTEGVAAALFAAHPVTAVRLAQVEPRNVGGEWWWMLSPPFANTMPGDRMAVPEAEVFAALSPLHWGNTNLSIAVYQSADAANEDLSRACVAVCRGRAGLPPLEYPA